MRGLSRRRFLRGLAASATALSARRPDAAPAAPPVSPPAPETVPSPAFLDADQREALGVLADDVLPGAAALGAVAYVEALLTAFEHDPPRIHGGGPYSGRHPDADGRAVRGSFGDFVPLDRVQERAWRLRLYGAEPADPLGPAVGLRELIGEGATRAFAVRERGVRRMWSGAGEGFRERFTALVIEATLGDPVYGGNHDGGGWRSISYGGDGLPLGYTPWDAGKGVYRERPDAPLRPRPGAADPAPLSWSTRFVLWVMTFLSRRQDPS